MIELDIPIRYQVRDYECGIISASMVIEGLTNNIPKIDHTQYKEGMSQDELLTILKDNKVKPFTFDTVTTQMVTQSILEGCPIIIAVTCPYQKVDHYSVIYGYSETGPLMANYYKDRTQVTWKELEESHLNEMIVCRLV